MWLCAFLCTCRWKRSANPLHPELHYACIRWVLQSTASMLNPIWPAEVARHMLTCSHSPWQRQRRGWKGKWGKRRKREASPASRSWPVQVGPVLTCCHWDPREGGGEWPSGEGVRVRAHGCICLQSKGVGGSAAISSSCCYKGPMISWKFTSSPVIIYVSWKSVRKSILEINLLWRQEGWQYLSQVTKHSIAEFFPPPFNHMNCSKSWRVHSGSSG